MLSISGISSSGGAANYFETDNYYAENDPESKLNSQWWGNTAVAIGISGQEVDLGKFKDLLDGHVSDDIKIGRIVEGELKHYPGWDLTFSAPKTVSLIAMADIRMNSVHNQAVDKALHYVQSAVVTTRTQINDQLVNVKTNSLLVARFNHDISRELDPQIHTHCVVNNITLNENGDFRSVDGRDFYQNKMLIGLIYRNELAHELTKMGYEIEKTHNDGRFEITGISSDVKEAFSQRREQIESFMQERGLSGSVAASMATLATRKDKTDVVDRTQLRNEHWSRMAELGFNPRELVAAVSAKIDVEAEAANKAVEAVKFAIDHLSQNEAVFSKVNILKESLLHSFGKTNLEAIQVAINQMERKEVIQVWDDKHYTTQKAVGMESAVQIRMNQGKGKLKPLLKNSEYLQTKLDSTNLTHGQKNAAELILTTQDRVIGIQGYAGVGKTTMLRFVNEEVKKEGHTILGFTPTATAAQQLERASTPRQDKTETVAARHAQELQQKTGIKSQTLASHLLKLEGELHQGKIPERGQIWVIDESGMINTKDFNRLLKLAEQADARVILVGDVKQLAAIEAGKPFHQLQAAGMETAKMDQIMRQDENQLAKAVYKSLDAKEIGKVLELLDQSISVQKDTGSSVIEFKSNEKNDPNKNMRPEMVQHMIHDYLSLTPEQRSQTIVITPGNIERTLFNTGVREGLIQEGQIGFQINSSVVIDRRLSTAQTKHSQYYHAGNIVTFNLRDYKSIGIQRGEYTKVVSTNTHLNTVTLQRENGQQVEWCPHKMAGNREGGVSVFEQHSRHIGVGDQIRWSRNDHPRGIRTSETAKIETITGNTITVKMQNGSQLDINADKLQDKHWDHAYAGTVYSVQGQDNVRVMALADSKQTSLITQQAFYTTISRAQSGIHLYIDDKDKIKDAIVDRSGIKTSALDQSDTANRLLVRPIERITDNGAGAEDGSVNGGTTGDADNETRIKSGGSGGMKGQDTEKDERKQLSR